MVLRLPHFLPASRWLIVVLITIGGLHNPACAQSDRVVSVTNVRFSTLGGTSLEIRYDLQVSHPGDSISLLVFRRDNTRLNVGVAFVTGDFGRNVTAGPNKRILWNVLANDYELDEDIRVQVLVNNANPPVRPQTVPQSPEPAVVMVPDNRPTPPPVPPNITAPISTTKSSRPGGPALALLSVLMPGLGNVFVQTPKPKVGFRPLLPVGIAGAVIYGFMQRTREQEQYSQYIQQRNREVGEAYFQEANASHHRYYIATRVAVAVWLTDIAATFFRGLRNQHRPRKNVTVHPGYQSTVPVATLTLRL